MFRTKHLIDLGLYNETSVHEGKDMKLRFESKYKLGHLNVPLYRYHKHENDIINNVDLVDHHEDKLNIIHGNS